MDAQVQTYIIALKAANSIKVACDTESKYITLKINTYTYDIFITGS